MSTVNVDYLLQTFTYETKRTIQLTAIVPVFLLPVSSTESGEHVAYDTGVTGLGEKIPITLLLQFACCPDVVFCKHVPALADTLRLTRSNFHSGASDTSVVTSLEKKSSIV